MIKGAVNPSALARFELGNEDRRRQESIVAWIAAPGRRSELADDVKTLPCIRVHRASDEAFHSHVELRGGRAELVARRLPVHTLTSKLHARIFDTPGMHGQLERLDQPYSVLWQQTQKVSVPGPYASIVPLD
jgi:hypothetical protein